MNLESITTDKLRAVLQEWLSAHMRNDGSTRTDIINRLTPIICDILREHGFKVLSDQDFNFVKKALDNIKIDKNM